MNTVITHFYNEEYLLPWWIEHHKKLFDYGILIDYNSTDRSYEICKELCPSHWKIVKSVNFHFDSKSNDAEIKMYEQSVEGFKIALTVTEFLIVPQPLEHLNNFMIQNDINYFKTYGVCMVDMFPEDLPTYDTHLVSQKHHGLISGYYVPNVKNCLQMGPDTFDAYNTLYGRYYHNKPYGNYLEGRHFLNDYGNNKIFTCYDVFTLKYKFSPWNEFNIKRLYEYVDRLKHNNDDIIIPLFDEMTYLYNHFLSTSHDLTDNFSFKKALEYTTGL